MTRHSALPGFRDFYPEEFALRKQIFDAWNEVARRYGFEAYDGPPLESLALYIEKSGPEIVNQLFNFTDKGGREVALRPEMTPTLVRMLGARVKGMPKPVRWYSTPQMFRYEKQQRGRLREHFQLNMDIIGETSVLADADLLAAALDVLQLLGLTSKDIVARVSDRRLLQAALLSLGIGEENLPVAYNVIDKVERDSRETCLQRLAELGLPAERGEAALSLTSLTFEEVSERFGRSEEGTRVVGEISRYLGALESLGLGDFVQFDMKIVRGLAYYTGIVFEIFDRGGNLRAICGGGRYDNLFEALTGTAVPALGFGFGDVVLGELLKEKKKVSGYRRSVDVYVIAVDDSVQNNALGLVADLRGRAQSVLFPYRASGVGKALKAAAAAGAREAVIVGPEEANDGALVVRNLETGNEERVGRSEYLERVAARGIAGRA